MVASRRIGRPRKPLTTDDERHGTWTTYCYYRCRCEPCRAAGRAFRRERIDALLSNPLDSRHGTVNGYTYGCRCTLCVEAKAYHTATVQIPDDKHGTYSGYSYYRCRCYACARAGREYSAARHPAYRWRKLLGLPSEPLELLDRVLVRDVTVDYPAWNVTRP